MVVQTGEDGGNGGRARARARDQSHSLLPRVRNRLADSSLSAPPSPSPLSSPISEKGGPEGRRGDLAMGKKIAWHPPPGQTVSVGTDIFHHRAYFAFPFRIRETHCFRRESLPPSICKFKRRSTYDSVPASSPPKPSNLFHPSCTLRRPQNRGKPRRRRKAEGGQKIERNGRRGRGRIIIGICPPPPRRPPPPTSAPFSSPAVEIGQNCPPPPPPPQDFAETNGAAPAEGGGGGSFNASLPPLPPLLLRPRNILPHRFTLCF